MSTVLFGELDRNASLPQIILSKYENGVRREICGAFSRSSDIKFVIECDPALAIDSVVIRVQPDGRNWFDMPFIREDSSRFSLSFNASRLCDSEKGGLIWYEFLLISPNRTYFTNTADNESFTLCDTNAGRFSMLIYEDGFDTPDWFKGNTMYQIFPDRFAKGGNCPKKPEAVLNTDWENGTPQFAEKRGAHLDNNEFFGGTLYGITEKLNYISSLGVGVIYLNPIFEAYSNHKYDTGDYMKVDEMFGGEDALELLLAEAKKRNIHIVLDGVFNHTGDDSKYFNAKGRYDTVGAYQSTDSPYRNWYRLLPDGSYETWWGIKILPRLNHECKDCADYFLGNDGVIESYIKKGASGWRLDVADELSDSFLDRLRTAAKRINKDAVIIGEVWENAATKISYGNRRRYLRGSQLDSVMNYPFRSALLSFIREKDASILADELTEIFASYPRCVSHCLMNILGTHDTERILSALGDEEFEALSPAELSQRRLSEKDKDKAVKLLKLASAIQYTVYGIPSLYYGDEAGMEGYHDPFCRMPFPWGKEDRELTEHYRKLGSIRKSESVFSSGEFKVVYANGGTLVFERKENGKVIYLAANADSEPKRLRTAFGCTDLLTDKRFEGEVIIPPLSALILKPDHTPTVE